VELVTCLVPAKCRELIIKKKYHVIWAKPNYMDNQFLFIMFAIAVIPGECGTRILDSVTSVNTCSVSIA
jgi:hypothetical protein